MFLSRFKITESVQYTRLIKIANYYYKINLIVNFYCRFMVDNTTKNEIIVFE